jgi:hypothetical protein
VTWDLGAAGRREVFDPRWVTHKDVNPDANAYDAGLFDALVVPFLDTPPPAGVPYQIDDLITGKRYRRKFRAIIRRGGPLMQVELDALDPADLQALYQSAIDRYWDVSAYREVRTAERADMDRLREAAR